MSEENQQPEEQQQPAQAEAKDVRLNDIRFGFVLTFPEQPDRETFCNAVVNVFQAACTGVLTDPNPLVNALKDAEKYDSKQFVFEGAFDHRTNQMEVSVSVVRDRKTVELAPAGSVVNIVKGFGTPPNRAARRRMGK